MKIKFETREELSQDILTLMEYRIINENDTFIASIDVMFIVHENTSYLKRFNYISIGAVKRVYGLTINEVFRDEVKFAELKQAAAYRIMKQMKEYIKSINSEDREILYVLDSDFVPTDEALLLQDSRGAGFILFLDESQVEQVKNI